MRDLIQEYKVNTLLFPAAITTTTSSTTARDVEVYDDDALAIASYGAIGVNGSVIVTITGSLVATPSTYDQTLATFVSATVSSQTAVANLNLAGIKNIKATATLPGSTSVAVSVVVLSRGLAKSSTLNSSTASEA